MMERVFQGERRIGYRLGRRNQNFVPGQVEFDVSLTLSTRSVE
jgi:hypothetical protein